MRNTYVAPTMEEARRDSEESVMGAHGFVASFHSDKSVSLRFYMNPGEQPDSDTELDWDFLMDRIFWLVHQIMWPKRWRRFRRCAALTRSLSRQAERRTSSTYVL